MTNSEDRLRSNRNSRHASSASFSQDENEGWNDALFWRQSELVALIDRLTGKDGAYATAITPLTIYRYSAPTPPVHGLQKPTFCLAVQGCKSALLGTETYLHDSSSYLPVSVDLPISARIVDASPEVPYLGLCLDLDPRQIGALLMEMETTESASRSGSALPVFAESATAPSLSVSRTPPSLLDAVWRLLCLLETPQDVAVLAPLALREILYRLLTGEQGPRLRQAVLANSPTQRIAGAINWLKRHYTEPLSIEMLAHEACMSPSGLHHHFKTVTSLSPLQYQKHLRLQEARRLMLYEACDATAASYRVGYNSPSQFNREYSRMFGAPPLRDIARLRSAS